MDMIGITAAMSISSTCVKSLWKNIYHIIYCKMIAITLIQCCTMVITVVASGASLLVCGIVRAVYIYIYVTRYAKTNHNYAQKIKFFNGFHNIFTASIVVANLKQTFCSLTELRLLLCRCLSSKHCETANYIQQCEFFNVSVYFLCDAFLRVKGNSISLIESPRRVVLFPNLFYLLTSISVELLLTEGVTGKDCLKVDQFAGKT